jgi:hypothetical protein
MKFLKTVFLFILFISYFNLVFLGGLRNRVQKLSLNFKDSFKRIINYDEIIRKLSNEKYIKNDNTLLLQNVEENLNSKEKNNFLHRENTNEHINNNITRIRLDIIKESKKAVEVLNSLCDAISLSEEFQNFLNIISKNEEYIKEFTDRSEVFNNSPLFIELRQNNADLDPPKAYSSLKIPCKTAIDCNLKKLTMMKCTVVRVALRTIYESLNVPLITIEKIVFSLCGCFYVETPNNRKIKCTLTTGQPGLPCSVTNQVLQGLFKLSFGIWKGYQTMSHLCRNPISPY